MNHNHQGSFEVKHEVQQVTDHLEIGGDTLAGVLNVFAEMGLLHLTEAGQQTLLTHMNSAERNRAPAAEEAQADESAWAT